jgi:hypothetical protein
MFLKMFSIKNECFLGREEEKNEETYLIQVQIQ